MKTNVPVFVVNLQRDHEKKAHMVSIAQANNVELEFIDAVYGKDLSQAQVDDIYDESLSQKALGRGLSRGELGCALSHLSIYQKMVEQNIQEALILEDDVDLSNDLVNVLGATSNFPADWEVMLFGYYSETATERISMANFWGRTKVTPSHQAVRLVELAFGTHGYMINRRGAEKLVNILSKIVKPIDHYTGSGRHVNMYALAPRVITLNEKFKMMSCINSERDAKLNQFQKGISLKLLTRHFWDFFRKIKIVFWLKKLPLRLLPLSKYSS